MILPKIKIQRLTQLSETRLFYKFLNHPQYPNHKNLIYNAHPKLQTLLESEVNSKAAIKKYIKNMMSTHRTAIKKAESDAVISTRSLKHCLEALGKSMGFRWKKPITYIARPTLLPFSPFNKSGFSFSILPRVYGKGLESFSRVAIHEISHFVLFEMLKSIEKEGRLSSDARHYLKEAITAALFNEAPLSRALKTENYPGNPEIRLLRIKFPFQASLPLVKWIRDEYNKSNNFPDLLIQLVKVFRASQQEWSKKRTMWNRYGKKIFEENQLRDNYSKPIFVTKKKG
ncbi:MAG: hypothetical protein AAB686_03900 [Patescibacteria group bacterium]